VSTAYLGLGSNEGDRRRHLQAAVERLHRHNEIRIVAASPVYETEAHTQPPDEEQPPFLNAVLRTAVDCDPKVLLHVAQEVERTEGRTRSETSPWRPRPLDIDLLAVDALTCQTDTLTLPHPRLGERRFVLRPWADLAPNFVVPPPFDQSVQSLLDQCPDTASVRRTDDELDLSAAEAPGARDARE
jgi:2-amino-4-hydroxy-6-hydroxymethyldihydropteridine diphosphokinase